MADTGAQRRELVFCHACQNEWHRDQHGLECPHCNSDIVEIIDENHDPRDNHIDLTGDDDHFDTASNTTASHQHPPHDFNPWQHDHPDPDEADIEHVAFSPAPGIHFERTSFRSATPLNGRSQTPNDAFGPLFQTFSSLLGGPPRQQGSPRVQSPVRPIEALFGPETPHEAQQYAYHRQHGPWTSDNPGAGRNSFTATARIFPANGPNANQPGQPLANVHAILQQIVATVHEHAHPEANLDGREGAHDSPFNLLREVLGQMGNPGLAVHGDAVYTEEALDRIVSQMMEQNTAGSAPGPASAAAIAALPKKPVDKSMTGSDGKAECSVCMEAVELGDEMTVLPCKHWFHGDCVGAWLKEHDTCPHCRQGIMPKDGEANAPRSPNQTPRHTQNPFATPTTGRPSMPAPPTGDFTQPGMEQPYVLGGYSSYPEPSHSVQPPGAFPPQSPTPPTPSTPNQTRRRGSGRERGTDGSGENAGSGVAGWFRNLRSGNSDRST